jgi:hypothetical protein
VSVVEHAQVLWLGGIGGADLTGLHFELGLTETATLNEDFICGEERRKRESDWRRATTRNGLTVLTIAMLEEPGQGTYEEARGLPRA